jgi:hypothetical protein
MSQLPSTGAVSPPSTEPWYRGVLVAIGWLVLGVAMIYAMLVCDFSLNLFDWRGHWSTEASLACGGYTAAFAASVALYRATRGPVGLGAAIIVTLGLAGLGLFILPPEPLTTGWFGRQIVSPFAYRAARAVVLLLPAIALAVQWRLHVPRRAWSGVGRPGE